VAAERRLIDVSKTVYILLFRGINVGGNKIVRMELLRKMLAELGFENVATYIQSGNVVLTSDKAAAEVTKAIEGAFPQAFGFSSRPTVRSLAEWQRVIDEDPFAQVRGEGKQMHAVFLDQQPSEAAVDGLKALASTEEMVLAKGVLYLYTPDGFGRSKVAEALDKVLRVPLTARNWNTVLKLAAMANPTP
jgi:uncharacterized protein (DUF1697 family)